MPYPLSPLLSSIALLLLLGVLAQSTMADENEDRKKLKSISADIHKVEKTLKRSASEREKLTHQLRKTELERASLEKGINQIESQLNGLQGLKPAGGPNSQMMMPIDNPELLYRVPQHATEDGNTVEGEAEQSAFTKNAIQYQVSVQFLSSKIKGMKLALKGE